MGDTYRDLEAYVARATGARQVFIDANPWPFLVRLPEALPELANPWSDELSFATHVPGLTDIDDDAELSAHAVVIQPVRKRPGGPFPSRVGVGRTRSCDAVLRFGSVSKLHAQFHVDETPWTLADLESANGTFVNGARLEPRRPVPVTLGDHLRFGAVEVDLIDAGTLYDRLRGLRRG